MQQASLRLSSVASNALGVSGRRMLKAIIRGEVDPEQLAGLALGTLKNEIPELMQALEGRTREHHRFLLARFLQEWKWYEEEIASLDQRIEQQICPFASAVTLWQTMPGGKPCDGL